MPKKPAYRQHARLWLQQDYDASTLSLGTTKSRFNAVNDAIASTYDEAKHRDDIEVSESMENTKKLPTNGMQVHSEYTMYGHFLCYKSFLKVLKKYVFFRPKLRH